MTQAGDLLKCCKPDRHRCMSSRCMSTFTFPKVPSPKPPNTIHSVFFTLPPHAYWRIYVLSPTLYQNTQCHTVQNSRSLVDTSPLLCRTLNSTIHFWFSYGHFKYWNNPSIEAAWFHWLAVRSSGKLCRLQKRCEKKPLKWNPPETAQRSRSNPMDLGSSVESPIWAAWQATTWIAEEPKLRTKQMWPT